MRVFIGDYEENRKIEVEIHNYDTWNLDQTLSYIIHPLLIQFRRYTDSAPVVDDEDVPVSLRKSSAPPVENPWDTDEFFFDRWNYVLDEMIWAFGTLEQESDFWDGHTFDNDAYKRYADRKQNAYRLFGKYYQSLWQ